MGENKAAKGRGGIRWDSVVEKVWKDIGGKQEEAMPADKFDGHRAEAQERL